MIEVRIDFGPGYRNYCARIAAGTVLLLGGGSKRVQGKDIAVAQQRLADYKARHHGKKA